jgi:uncharacterized protein with HEPN domain
MVRDSRHFAQDILDAIDVVHRAIRDKSFSDFESEEMLRFGLERAIEIISEASRHIPEDFKAMRAEVPWQQIKAIGNVLRHEYHGLSNNIIWTAITDELPRLQVAVRAILDQMNRF